MAAILPVGRVIRSVVLVTAYVVPAVIVWAIAGLVLNILPLRTVALIVAVAYAGAYGLLEANGRGRPAPPGTSWQVPGGWVRGSPAWRRMMLWGFVLGPGFLTRNPYAGFGLLLLVLAAVGNVRDGLVLAVILGAAHAAGRACALLRDAHGIDVANYLESVRKLMYWRRFDGYALLTIGGAAMVACLRALAG
jgi:hypothetical protein